MSGFFELVENFFEKMYNLFILVKCGLGIIDHQSLISVSATTI